MALRLRLEGISYAYPSAGRESAALEGVSLEIEPGEFFCVAGPNGSGKSTLAQVMAGLLTPASGRLYYGEAPVEGRGDRLALRGKVGLLFQSPEDQLFADTVLKDISFGPRNHGYRGEELERAVRDASALVGLPLEELGGRSPFTLSSGEKRRVALAGVLAMEPDVLVLDEPFIGLDNEGRVKLRESLAGYRAARGASVVMVTHELADAWPLADRFALLSGGRLAGVEDKSELVTGEVDLSALGMKLPQWVALARELLRSGISVTDPADPRAIARAMAEHREAHGGR